jgi:hypothetical protein
VKKEGGRLDILKHEGGRLDNQIILGGRLDICRYYYYYYYCRYTCFNQRARVSLYCNTYALSIDGCLFVFSAAVLTVYTRFAWVTCIEHVTHKRITTNNYYYYYGKYLPCHTEF